MRQMKACAIVKRKRNPVHNIILRGPWRNVSIFFFYNSKLYFYQMCSKATALAVYAVDNHPNEKKDEMFAI